VTPCLRHIAMAGLVVAAATCASGGEDAAAPRLSAEVTAAFGGWFRPGCPVAFRVALTNPGRAFEGDMDLVVEGITWRTRVQVGSQATATLHVLAAVHSAASPVELVVRGEAGEEMLRQRVATGLRQRSAEGALVAVMDDDADAGPRLKAQGLAVAEMGGEDLPHWGSSYANIDAAIIVGAGLGWQTEVLRAAAHTGGPVVFVLKPGEAVHEGTALGGLRAPRQATGEEWLREVAKQEDVEPLADGLVWREGLGRVAVGPPSDEFLAAVADLARAAASRRRGAGDVTVAPEVYEAFDAPVWSGRTRWRVAGAALAMLAAVVVVALAVPRNWGRRARVICVLWAVVLLALVARWAILPAEPAVMDTLTVVEAAEGSDVGPATTLVALNGAARGAVTVEIGGGAEIVPVYYEASDAGTWGDVVVEGDGGGARTLTCGVHRGVRRCFAMWWEASWRAGELADTEGDSVVVRRRRVSVGDGWQPVRRLRGWEEPAGSVLRWQARRWAGGGTFRASCKRLPWQVVHSSRLLEARRHPALIWAEAQDD